MYGFGKSAQGGLLVRGPPPKPVSQRRRRNRTLPTTVLPAEGRQEPVPELPEKPDGWLPATRKWWSRIWTSPMATQWIDADFDTILRLALMQDADARGEGNATLRREIRLLHEAFGLSPASRARLRWEIGEP
jgi:hypothetical protein